MMVIYDLVLAKLLGLSVLPWLVSMSEVLARSYTTVKGVMSWVMK